MMSYLLREVYLIGLAHNSFCGSTMTKRYTVCEALDHIFDHDTGEEKRVLVKL